MPNLAELEQLEPSAACYGNRFPQNLCCTIRNYQTQNGDLLLKHSPSSRVSEPLHFPLWPRPVVIGPNLPY